MVSKRLKGHYLRSYEQFQRKKTDFKGDFQAKIELKIVFTREFLSKKNDQKMG